MKKTILILGTLALITGAVVGLALWWAQGPGPALGQATEFKVEAGQGANAIAENLERHGLIRSALALRVLARLDPQATPYKQGTYTFMPGDTLGSIHQALQRGVSTTVKVTLADGLTLRRIAAILEERQVTTAEAFLAAAHDPEVLDRLGIPFDSAQGFVFPETYFLPTDWTAEAILAHLVGQFWKEMEALAPEYRTMSPEVLRDRVILASIIEREYVDPQEAPLMASVFYNRMARGIRLESCSTVVYVMTEEEGLPHPTRIFYRDLERPSAYNTYRVTGLPPGPISNPGRVALAAALYPAETDYMFFVLRDPDAKQHHFSKTWNEHSQAATLYLKKL